MTTHVARTSTTPFDFHGLQIRELTPEALTSASVPEVEIPSRGAHPTARSTKSDQLYLCVEGTAAFHIQGQQRLQYLDTLLIKKGECFSYSNDTDAVARLLLVHIPPFDLAAQELIP